MSSCLSNRIFAINGSWKTSVSVHEIGRYGEILWSDYLHVYSSENTIWEIWANAFRSHTKNYFQFLELLLIRFQRAQYVFYRSFTLEVASSTPALLFYTYAWPKIDSFAIHSFSGLEKHSRSNFKHWKSFFHGLLYFFIHTLGPKSIHLPFIHSQGLKSSVEATSGTEKRFL